MINMVNLYMKVNFKWIKTWKGKTILYNGKIQFEGEYSNGLGWKGVDYDRYGNFINELDNENNEVILYNYNGEHIYDGEFLKGKN